MQTDFMKPLKISDSEKIELIVANLTEILKERFGESSQKTNVKIGRERVNFACPYCGDSFTNEQKKRGNIFYSSLTFHCYNCNAHRTLNTFLKDHGKLTAGWGKINQLAADSLTIQTNSKNVDSDKILNALVDPSVSNNLFTRDELKTKLKLIEIPGSRIEVYLHKRLQTDNKRFLWDDYRRKLYILNYRNSDDAIVGWQLRNFGKYANSGQKYLTYKWSKACEVLGREIDESEVDVIALDKISHTFNIFNVDFSRPITVFEGPMDSFLFRNSIALSSLHINTPIESDNFRYIFDYDKPGQLKALEFLQKGETVFLWKNFLKETDIKLNTSKKIDWNDVMVYCKMNDKRISGISKYFTSDKYDVVQL